MQCVECRTHAQNSRSSIHYHVLSKHFLLTYICLKSNTYHVVGWHAFLNFGGKRAILPLIHSWQQQKTIRRILLLSSYVELPQRGSPSTYRTTMFHLPEPGACNIETHRYMVWNSKKDDRTSWNPLLLDLLVVVLVVFPSPWPYRE